MSGEREIRDRIRETQTTARLVVATHGLEAKMAQRAAFGNVKFERKGISEVISAAGSTDPLEQNKATAERGLMDEKGKYDRHEFILKQFDNLAVLSRAAQAGDQEASKKLPYQKLYVELATRKLLKVGILEPEILSNLIPRAEKLGINLKTEPEETYINTSDSRREPVLKKVAGTVAKVLSVSKGSRK